jgi:exosome complex component RRP4
MFGEGRRFVIPGELIASGRYLLGRNVYQVGDKIFSNRVGLLEIDRGRIHVIPLRGCYVPNVGDLVVGKVVNASLFKWVVDINSPYLAELPISEATRRRVDPRRFDLSKIYAIGDVIKAEVIAFDRTKNPTLTTKGVGLGKVREGRIVRMSPMKVPRLIGRKGSMINMIKRELNCYITVGQNGFIIVKGKNREDEEFVASLIQKIDEESHVKGLTDKIGEIIMKRREM